MSFETIVGILYFSSFIIGIICFNLMDRSVEKAKKEGREVKEDGCNNAGCVISLAIFIITSIIVSFYTCSGSSNHNHDINIEVPAHPG